MRRSGRPVFFVLSAVRALIYVLDVKKSVLNNSQCIDLVQQSAELDAVELHGLVGLGGKPCDSRDHEAPSPPSRTG